MAFRGLLGDFRVMIPMLEAIEVQSLKNSISLSLFIAILMGFFVKNNKKIPLPVNYL